LVHAGRRSFGEGLAESLGAPVTDDPGSWAGGQSGRRYVPPSRSSSPMPGTTGWATAGPPWATNPVETKDPPKCVKSAPFERVKNGTGDFRVLPWQPDFVE